MTSVLSDANTVRARSVGSDIRNELAVRDGLFKDVFQDRGAYVSCPINTEQECVRNSQRSVWCIVKVPDAGRNVLTASVI